jgi:uncharacterized membrane protein
VTGRLMSAGSAITTATLVVGLAMEAHGRWARTADLLIFTGLLVLMAIPVVRLAAAIGEEIRARDWRFVALGLVVAALLACSVAIGMIYRS